MAETGTPDSGRAGLRARSGATGRAPRGELQLTSETIRPVRPYNGYVLLRSRKGDPGDSPYDRHSVVEAH